MPVLSILTPGEKVTSDDARLFNVNDLAAALGVNRAFISKLKRCGFKMPCGRATVAMTHDFMRSNPDLTDPRTPEHRRQPQLEKVAQ